MKKIIIDTAKGLVVVLGIALGLMSLAVLMLSYPLLFTISAYLLVAWIIGSTM